MYARAIYSFWKGIERIHSLSERGKCVCVSAATLETDEAEETGNFSKAMKSSNITDTIPNESVPQSFQEKAVIK